MSLLMDALRRAEAEKKQQEARASRVAPAPVASLDSGTQTRVSPFTGSEDVTVQIESRAMAQAAAASVRAVEDGDVSRSMSVLPERLALEPLEGELSAANLALAPDYATATTLGAAGQPPEQTSTMPSSREVQNDLNAYFDQSQVVEVPRSGRRGADTLEDVAAHTVVSAQTVFTAGERPRAGRIVLLGTSFAIVTVLAIGAIGLYYALPEHGPQEVPSPTVASGVEKSAVRELPVVPLDTRGKAASSALVRIDTQPPPAPLDAPAAAPAAASPPPAPVAGSAEPLAAAAGAAAPSTSTEPRVPAAVQAPSPAAVKARTPAFADAPVTDVSAGELRIARSPLATTQDAALHRAYAAYGAGDLAGADALYQATLARAPESRDALLGLGAVALKRGDLSRAYKYYAAVLKRSPDDPVASAALFSLTGGEGDATAARLRLMLDSHGDAAFIHFALGNWYARKQRWSDAQQAYFNAVRLDDGNADYTYNLAISLDRMGQKPAALAYYQKSLSLADSAGASFNPSTVLERITSLSTAP